MFIFINLMNGEFFLEIFYSPNKLFRSVHCSVLYLFLKNTFREMRVGLSTGPYNIHLQIGNVFSDYSVFIPKHQGGELHHHQKPNGL